MPRPYKDLSNPPRLGCRVGARCVSLRGVVGIIVTGRGIVPLELFTNRARHASPLHRSIEPTAPGMPRRRPLRSSAGVITIIWGNLGNPGLGAPACLTFVVDDHSLWSKIVVDQAL